MDIYKQYGLLPVYRSDQTQDWQKEGYFYNWQLAKKWIPRDKLVSFRSPLVNGSYTAPTQITIRKLLINGGLKTVVESNSFNVSFTKVQKGDQYYYYYQQGLFSDDANDYLTIGCLYDILFEDSNGTQFITDIFIAIEETDYYYYTEDSQILQTEDGQNLIFE